MEKATITDLYQEILPAFKNLHFRWENEKKYENIEEYGEVIRPIVEKMGGEFLKMNRKPFSFTFLFQGERDIKWK